MVKNKFNTFEDFYFSYGKAFETMFDTNETRLYELWQEDTLQGYPNSPAGSAWESELKALYVAIRLAKPKNILEIGNWKGYSTQHIQLAIDNNNFGKVCAVDIEEKLSKDIKKKVDIRIVKDSLEFLREGNHAFDFIAHDGDHAYKHVKEELQLMTDHASVDFFIWSHDYYAPKRAQVNVKQAWDEEGICFAEWYPLRDSKSDCGFVLGKYEI